MKKILRKVLDFINMILSIPFMIVIVICVGILMLLDLIFDIEMFRIHVAWIKCLFKLFFKPMDEYEEDNNEEISQEETES